MDGYRRSFPLWRNWTPKAPYQTIGNFVGNVYGAKAAQATFFDTSPEAILGITFFPVTPHSFYLARSPEYMQWTYGKIAAAMPALPGQADVSQWNLTMDSLEATFAPADAWKDFANALDAKVSESGGKNARPYPGWKPINLENCRKFIVTACGSDSGVDKLLGDAFFRTYRWIRLLQLHGTPDPDYVANTPFGVALKEGDKLTFLAYNPTSKSRSVTFYQAGTKGLKIVKTFSARPGKVTVNGSVDLYVTTSDVSMQPNGNGAIEMDISNAGPDTATDVVFNVSADENLTLQGVAIGQGTCTASGSGEYHCELGKVEPGATLQATISAVDSTAGTDSVHGHVLTSASELDPTNNYATSTVTIESKDNSGGGGAFGWFVLVVLLSLAAVTLIGRNRQKRANSWGPERRQRAPDLAKSRTTGT